MVAKRLDQPYRPGVRGWQKLRSRLTAEAIVGGVIGPLHAPRVLLLGRLDRDGHLHLVGRTTELTPTSARTVAAQLRPHTGPAHPWPNPLPSTRWGRPGPPTLFSPVLPRLVVEVTVDTAVEHHRWRHPAHFVRIRPDLRIHDLTPLPSTSTPQPRRIQAG